jgi:SAM-dependent methyltransferase
MTDPFVQFKAVQRDVWSVFAPLAAFTTPPAAELVKYAQVKPGAAVLDVACGTGVVSVTAARAGANVKGLDLSPVLVEAARANATIAGLLIDFVEGDAESLPYPDASFDFVLSQYGHMFAPRPDVTIAEMLRVLRPGGRIAFSTWPPDQFVGMLFPLVGKHMPPPPGVAPPPAWGDPNVVRERLGSAVKGVQFGRALMTIPALSVPHFRASLEATAGPIAKLVSTFPADSPKLAEFRAELDSLIEQFFEGNTVMQHYLMTRATKV